MASEVDIVNNALLKLKANTIQSIGQSGIEGESSEILYPQVRDAVLRAHPWNFAIGRSVLNQLTDTPAFEFDYQYQLPTDCLRALELYNAPTADWQIEEDMLLTSESSAQLRYIKKITDTGRYDPLFVEALATRLASEMAVPITGSKATRDKLFQLYTVKIQEARTRDSQEGQPENLRSSTWVQSRGTDFSWTER